MKVFRLSYIICLKQYACLKEQLNQLDEEQQKTVWDIFGFEKKGIKIGDMKVIVYDGILLHLRRDALKTYTLIWYDGPNLP